MSAEGNTAYSEEVLASEACAAPLAIDPVGTLLAENTLRVERLPHDGSFFIENGVGNIALLDPGAKRLKRAIHGDEPEAYDMFAPGWSSYVYSTDVSVPSILLSGVFHPEHGVDAQTVEVEATDVTANIVQLPEEFDAHPAKADLIEATRAFNYYLATINGYKRPEAQKSAEITPSDVVTAFSRASKLMLAQFAETEEISLVHIEQLLRANGNTRKQYYQVRPAPVAVLGNLPAARFLQPIVKVLHRANLHQVSAVVHGERAPLDKGDLTALVRNSRFHDIENGSHRAQAKEQLRLEQAA